MAEQGPPRRNIPNGVSIYTESGELISQFMRKREDNPTQPHGICLDSKGNIYLAELESSKKNDQRVSKFVRM